MTLARSCIPYAETRVAFALRHVLARRRRRAAAEVGATAKAGPIRLDLLARRARAQAASTCVVVEGITALLLVAKILALTDRQWSCGAPVASHVGAHAVAVLRSDGPVPAIGC